MHTVSARLGSALVPLAVMTVTLVALLATLATGDAFATSTELTGLVEAGFRRP